MKKATLHCVLLYTSLMILLAACAQTPEQIQTAVAQTLTAMPSRTPYPIYTPQPDDAPINSQSQPSQEEAASIVSYVNNVAKIVEVNTDAILNIGKLINESGDGFSKSKDTTWNNNLSEQVQTVIKCSSDIRSLEPPQNVKFLNLHITLLNSTHYYEIFVRLLVDAIEHTDSEQLERAIYAMKIGNDYFFEANEIINLIKECAPYCDLDS